MPQRFCCAQQQFKHANSLLQNIAEGAIIQQDHAYTFKRAIQEHSSSCQSFAQATDESARPRQHDSKCKLRAFKLLTKPCTGTRRGKTTFTSFKHANPWALAKALLKERMSQQNSVYIVQRHANQELLDSCQTLQRERRVNNHWSQQLLKCYQPTLTTPSGLHLGRQLT